MTYGEAKLPDAKKELQGRNACIFIEDFMSLKCIEFHFYFLQIHFISAD